MALDGAANKPVDYSGNPDRILYEDVEGDGSHSPGPGDHSGNPKPIAIEGEVEGAGHGQRSAEPQEPEAPPFQRIITPPPPPIPGNPDISQLQVLEEMYKDDIRGEDVNHNAKYVNYLALYPQFRRARQAMDRLPQAPAPDAAQVEYDHKRCCVLF